jgi:hypothetical protein
MKKLTAVTLALCMNLFPAFSQFTAQQEEIIKKIDKEKSFESWEYKDSIFYPFPNFKDKMVYIYYDLNKDGIVDLGVVFDLTYSYLGKDGKIQLVPGKKAYMVMVIDEKTNKQLVYGDIDKDGKLETRLLIPGNKK